MDKKYISPKCNVYMIEIEDMIAASIQQGPGNGDHDASTKVFRFDQGFDFGDEAEIEE